MFIETLFPEFGLISDMDVLSLVLKAGAVLGYLFYIIFAFVVVKQVYLMTDTLKVGLEWLLRFVSLAHLAFSIGAFIVTLIIL